MSIMTNLNPKPQPHARIVTKRFCLLPDHAAEDKEVYAQEASQMFAEWQQLIDQRVRGERVGGVWCVADRCGSRRGDSWQEVDEGWALRIPAHPTPAAYHMRRALGACAWSKQRRCVRPHPKALT